MLFRLRPTLSFLFLVIFVFACKENQKDYIFELTTLAQDTVDLADTNQFLIPYDMSFPVDYRVNPEIDYYTHVSSNEATQLAYVFTNISGLAHNSLQAELTFLGSGLQYTVSLDSLPKYAGDTFNLALTERDLGILNAYTSIYFTDTIVMNGVADSIPFSFDAVLVTSSEVIVPVFD